jgi:hypothetical protein
MPKREQFFQDLAAKDADGADNRQAALLIVQVGAMPNELQLITQIAEYDAAAEGLRPIRNYIVRVLGVLEHRVVSLGTTVASVSIADDHPLLWEYNTRPTALFFRGNVDHAAANDLTLDILQTHASTFGPWRRFPEYLNVQQPLATLLQSGGGLLGQMPQPLADKLVPVLERHGLETKLQHGTPYVQAHDNPALLQQKLAVLLFGASYFISYAFSFDEMGTKPKAIPTK